MFSHFIINFLRNKYFGILLGIGGLGIGDWAQSPIPNPQSPIPNPQSPNIYLIYIRMHIY